SGYLISAAFFHTVNLNQGSLAQNDLPTLAKRLAECLHQYGCKEQYFVRKAQKHISDLLDRFNIRTVKVGYGPKTVQSARRFNFQVDPPGILSALGPRHDNDFAEVEKILILPTSEEILADRSPFLPFHITETIDHEGISTLVDANF